MRATIPKRQLTQQAETVELPGGIARFGVLQWSS